MISIECPYDGVENKFPPSRISTKNGNFCNSHCWFRYRIEILKNHPLKGYNPSKETRQKMSKAQIKRFETEIPYNKGLKQPGKINATSFKKGQKAWNKGLHNSWITGDKNSNWKGEKVGNKGLHQWVARNLGNAKEGICVDCGGDKFLEWSNESGKYKRDLTDWKIRCKKCHSKHDRHIKMKGALKRNFNEKGHRLIV